MLGHHCGKPTKPVKSETGSFSRRCQACGQVFTQRKRVAGSKTFKLNAHQVAFLKSVVQKYAELHFGQVTPADEQQKLAQSILEKLD